MGKIILTGDRPTGRLHIGHYVGSLRRRVELQNSGLFDKIFIMIADAQALTDNADNPDKVRQNILEVALDYMAAGLDPSKSTLFIQSQISELTELTFFYMNLVTVQRLQRNPTVKQEMAMRGFSDSSEGFAESERYMQLPRDLLILALPSVPGRRLHASVSGRSISGSTSTGEYTELNLRTISRVCSIIGSWSSPAGTVVALNAVISAAWLIG